MHIILASASPNRKELLERIGLPFSVVVSNVCENVAPGLSTAEYVMTLARQKAESVAAAYPEACVIGADTVVDLDGRILGKPHTPENAKAFLSAMQGRKHLVYTGLAVSARGVTAVDVEKTSVTFAPMSEEEIDWYVPLWSSWRARSCPVLLPCRVSKFEQTYYHTGYAEMLHDKIRPCFFGGG